MDPTIQLASFPEFQEQLTSRDSLHTGDIVYVWDNWNCMIVCCGTCRWSTYGNGTPGALEIHSGAEDKWNTIKHDHNFEYYVFPKTINSDPSMFSKDKMRLEAREREVRKRVDDLTELVEILGTLTETGLKAAETKIRNLEEKFEQLLKVAELQQDQMDRIREANNKVRQLITNFMEAHRGNLPGRG